MGKIEKARFWVGVLYPENMILGWQEQIGDLLELPYAYCIHDKDADGVDDERKVHLHLILSFSNTTTYKHAMNVFNLLSANGKKCLSSCEAIVNVRSKYDYLIHRTETAKKQGKFQYDAKERVIGNNFDIGAYEQLGIKEKNDMCKELCIAIRDNGFTNFVDFFDFVMVAYDDSNYFEIVKSYSGLFERLTRGNYLKVQRGQNVI